MFRLKNAVFWDEMPCSLAVEYRIFGGIYYPDFRADRITTSRLFSQRLPGRNFVNLEDGGITFLRNVDVNLRTCMVAKLRKGHIIMVKLC
jgi:hypothetical protein